MSLQMTPKTGLLFMKVGLHAGETFTDILERKSKEYDKTGMIFWGYGGNTCHPSLHVQPFAKMMVEKRGNVYIVMQEINSRHAATGMVAKEYSEDGINWKPIPKGIEVRGSRYAVVMEQLQVGALDIDLSEYQVAVGPSMGKSADSYIGGHVDKACLIQAPKKEEIQQLKDVKKITQFAKLQSPYAVFTR